MTGTEISGIPAAKQSLYADSIIGMSLKQQLEIDRRATDR